MDLKTFNKMLSKKQNNKSNVVKKIDEEEADENNTDSSSNNKKKEGVKKKQTRGPGGKPLTIRQSRDLQIREMKRRFMRRKPKPMSTSTRYSPKNEILAIQEAMIPPKPLVSTYIQLIIQLGYCTMFAAVLPIVGVIIAIFNIFIIRC